MAMTFRLAKPDQCSDIRQLFMTALGPMATQLGNSIAADAYSDLSDKIGERNLYILAKGEEIVAAIAFHEEDSALYIDTIAVRPDQQGKGYGAQLLREAEMIAESRELYCLKLHTPELTNGLLDYYPSHGYQESHRALPVHGLDQCLRVHFIKNLARHSIVADMAHEHDRILEAEPR